MDGAQPFEYRPTAPAAATTPAAPQQNDNDMAAEPQAPQDAYLMNASVQSAPTDPGEYSNLGVDLASAMAGEGIQPVVLFGTNNSGKTSLLLSLFSTLKTQSRLETGLFLSDPILATSSPIGQKLHQDARHTFQVKTQQFMDGVKIGKTNIDLPFFIPVEFRPKNKDPVRFAFLESNGEWYRPTRGGDTLFPQLKNAIEGFVSCFQGGILFIYLVPYTQSEVYRSAGGGVTDAREVEDASLAISGVLQAYNDIRASHRHQDRHMMLVSKWDAHEKGNADLADASSVDRAELEAFCDRRYNQALSTFRGMQLPAGQAMLNAYSSGIINENGLRRPCHDYPERLWTWLYRSALANRDAMPVSPFPEKPQPPALWRAITSVLDKLSS